MLRLLLRKLRRLVEVLTTDEMAAKRWLAAFGHGGGAFLLSSALTVFPFADAGDPAAIMKEVQSWSRSDWIWRIALAGFFAVRGMVKAKAPNLTIDEIHTALAARGAFGTPPPVAPPGAPT